MSGFEVISEIEPATRPELMRVMLDRVEHDADAGVELAGELVREIRDSGAFAGVHLIPVGRYRDMARRLETVL
jgi:methylenetetrahydrofolate reductase (NADPH)